MPLQPLEEKLGSNICKGLLGFHALTGSDQTGKLFVFSKLTCWDKYMASPQTTLEAFENLIILLDEETEENLVNLVLQLYMKQRSKSVTTLGILNGVCFRYIRANQTDYHPPIKHIDRY